GLAHAVARRRAAPAAGQRHPLAGPDPRVRAAAQHRRLVRRVRGEGRRPAVDRARGAGADLVSRCGGYAPTPTLPRERGRGLWLTEAVPSTSATSLFLLRLRGRAGEGRPFPRARRPRSHAHQPPPPAFPYRGASHSVLRFPGTPDDP